MSATCTISNINKSIRNHICKQKAGKKLENSMQYSFGFLVSFFFNKNNIAYDRLNIAYYMYYYIYSLYLKSIVGTCHFGSTPNLKIKNGLLPFKKCMCIVPLWWSSLGSITSEWHIAVISLLLQLLCCGMKHGKLRHVLYCLGLPWVCHACETVSSVALGIQIRRNVTCHDREVCRKRE